MFSTDFFLNITHLYEYEHHADPRRSVLQRLRRRPPGPWGPMWPLAVAVLRPHCPRHTQGAWLDGSADIAAVIAGLQRTATSGLLRAAGWPRLTSLGGGGRCGPRGERAGLGPPAADLLRAEPARAAQLSSRCSQVSTPRASHRLQGTLGTPSPGHREVDHTRVSKVHGKGRTGARRRQDAMLGR